VVGINFVERRVYICEVAVHLVTGLQYVKDKRPDTEARFIKKYNKCIDYGEKKFHDYARHYMLWSPIVKQSGGNAIYDQLKAVTNVRDSIRDSRGVTIELVVNEEFQRALGKVREYAAKTNEELKSPVLRLLQIEAKLEKHVKKIRASSKHAAEPPL
jgi:transcriptional regulator NrdR family protein